MCGIIAVLRRASGRSAPAPRALADAVATAVGALADGLQIPAVDRAAAVLRDLDRELRGVPGLWCLLQDRATATAAARELDSVQARLQQHERQLDQTQAEVAEVELERRNASLVALKDSLWAVLKDRLPHAAQTLDLANGEVPHQASAAAFSAVQLALSALDRLEVRGRDSAGVSVLVDGVDPARFRAAIAARSTDPLFRNRSVREAAGRLCFVYKHAAEIGELGDNTAALRAAMRADQLLQQVLREPRVEALVLGHTRWASVGIISEPNAHPLNQEETGGGALPFVLAALNGDVDNHLDLVTQHGLQLAPEITTDAKVIPVLVARAMQGGKDLAEAFRGTVATFEGSVAIAAVTANDPHRLALALRGSGQALYVGTAPDTFVVASEPYGVIEECERYLRMDGETPGNPANPSASRGQVIVLDRALAGDIAGIRRLAYDGTALPVQERQLTRSAVTTRDVDRAGYPHFLLKEITEAPASLQKTLRGRIVRHGGRLRTALPADSLPARVVDGLRRGQFRHLLVIGQGTAAVAGQAVAAAITRALRGQGPNVRALPATELSGFAMRDDMADTLIVAVSQSGTTTDTNRTVDLVRGRGAVVLAIVNRRGSDLCDKADGVLFTSDGRDIEMSVASTKAFYAQCAAGFLLGCALGRAAGTLEDAAEDELLHALIALPAAMRELLRHDAGITAIAQRHATQRRHWALVGNGDNRIAAAEVRIKLSELCYKSIACDATEDKKHIDLSSEPMILVCAAGLTGSTADDVAKEVAIYKAHKSCPIVIATAGENRFTAAAATIHVPAVHPALSFLMSAIAGHLFGYRAALAIDALALPLRRCRAAVEAVADDAALRAEPLRSLRERLAEPWRTFRSDLTAGRYDGALGAGPTARLVAIGNYVVGHNSLDHHVDEFGQPATPGQLIDAFTAALTAGIDELTRPVDAIKHQAKTVTVGISRADEAMLTVPLVRELLAAGAVRDGISYRDLRALCALDAAVGAVTGSTRYRVDGDPDQGTVAVVSQTGTAAGLRSRTAQNPALRGTKHLVAAERQLFVARGRSDGRTVILVPEVEQGRVAAITLLHVRFHERMSAAAMRGVLAGYRSRLSAVQDAVTETEPQFDERMLELLPPADLLTEPVYVLADRWRQLQSKG